MPKNLNPFEERLYTEYDLKGRVRMAIVISIVLFVGFLYRLAKAANGLAQGRADIRDFAHAKDHDHNGQD